MSNLDVQLRTFLQVAQHGSFRRAAEELFVTQAAVTSRIKLLEEWLGFDVFERHRRGADLTAQGVSFLDYARNALNVIERGREEARRASGYRANYRFMSQYLLLESYALDWVDWMRRQAEDVSVGIDSGPSMVAAERISQGLLDIAVGYQYQMTRGVVFEKLFNETLILVTSFVDPADWRDNYIPIGWDDEFDDEQRRFIGEPEYGYPLRTQFIDAARALVLREPGSAYVVERAAQPLIERGLVRRVLEAPVFERPAYALYPDRPSYPEIQETALAGLREVATRYQR